MRLVRVTQLETFHKMLSCPERLDDFYSEQKVMESISGEFQGNDLTRIGTAFHRTVEGDYSDTQMVDRGIRFNIDGFPIFLNYEALKVASDYKESMPGATHELRNFVEIEGLKVTGCADIIWGNEIHDIKTKFSTPSDTDYINSYQWRFYLMMFGGDKFDFDLFPFVGHSNKDGGDARGCSCSRYTPAITCYPYNKLETDCINLVREFKKWVAFRNVELPEYSKNIILH